jgi:hypothetical protein
MTSLPWSLDPPLPERRGHPDGAILWVTPLGGRRQHFQDLTLGKKSTEHVQITGDKRWRSPFRFGVTSYLSTWVSDWLLPGSAVSMTLRECVVRAAMHPPLDWLGDGVDIHIVRDGIPFWGIFGGVEIRPDDEEPSGPESTQIDIPVPGHGDYVLVASGLCNAESRSVRVGAQGIDLGVLDLWKDWKRVIVRCQDSKGRPAAGARVFLRGLWWGTHVWVEVPCNAEGTAEAFAPSRYAIPAMAVLNDVRSYFHLSSWTDAMNVAIADHDRRLDRSANPNADGTGSRR